MAQELKTTNQPNQPKYLWFLMLSYTMVLVLANWFDPRLVQVFGLTTDAGTLIFPLSFLLADLITEVYGYQHARRAIWIGFLFNALFILYGQIIIHLPSPHYQTHNALFSKILALDIRIIIASTISYFIAAPLNAFLLAKLKIYAKGQLMWLRFILSSCFAAGMDSAIFGTIAFYGLMNNSHLLTLIIVMWLIKLSIEILGLPISLALAYKLKQTEKIDVYDTNTKFNLFKLDVTYDTIDNHFTK